MAYIGTKPANQVIDSTLIADGTVTPSDLSTGKPVWDTSGNLGVGTASPVSLGAGYGTIDVRGSSGGGFRWGSSSNSSYTYSDSGGLVISTANALPLSLSTNNTERMRIDSSGRVTKPYQPAFSAYSNDTTSFTGGRVIVWDNTDVNIGSHYSTSTGRFTAPVAGTYFFTATGQGQGVSTAYMEIKFRKNGTDVHTYSDSVIETSTGVHRNAVASLILTLAANDYVEVYAPNGIRRIQCGFQGYLIG